MLFFKYTVLFSVFSICTLIGNLISKKYKNRVIELKSFKEIYNILESKIKFTYEPIGDIFEEIPNLSKLGNINKIFIETKSNLNKYDLKKSWCNAIDCNKDKLNLSKEDINTIKSFGNMLGKTDVQGQLNEINLHTSFLERQINLAEEECKKNEKMYRTLGTIFGLAITIILI